MSTQPEPAQALEELRQEWLSEPEPAFLNGLHDHGFSWDDINALAAILEHEHMEIVPEGATAAARAEPVDPLQLADALHEVMCTTSHHDRGKERECRNWPNARNIALSAAPRVLSAARAEVARRLDDKAGLPPATCYRMHTEADEHRGVFGAVWIADLKRVLLEGAE